MTVIGVAGGGPLPVRWRAGVAGPADERRRRAGSTSAYVTTSVSPAPASASRTTSRTAIGSRAVGRHRRVGERRLDRFVAGDAGDLLGDVGLDGEVGPPGRHDRGEDRSLARRRPAAGCHERPGSCVPGRRRLRGDADPGEERRLGVGRERRSRAGGSRRAGRNATRAGSGSTGAVSTRPGATSPPAQATTSWATRSAPMRARRTSWPFSKRRLASERRA